MVAAAGERRGLWRSRWAAVGAAVAVTLGGGGMVAVNAASGPASSVITVDPVRVLDTRSDVGLPGPFVSAVSQKLQVTGAVPTSTGTQTPVPVGATGVLLNVTVVSPSANGFLSVRPGDATGVASTSSLNFNAGDLIPNSVQVGLPTSGANAGQIDITYDAYGAKGPTTEVLIDVVGYMVAGGGGATGPAGPAGATGPQGPAGTSGLAPIDRFTPRQLVSGAILECSSTALSPTTATCDGVKLNTLDVSISLPSMNQICNVVTGNIATSIVGIAPNSNPKFVWDGTKWVVSSAPQSAGTGVTCNL